MAIERTFSIIKPDATKLGVVGKIIARFESEGLRICAMKKPRPAALAYRPPYRYH